MHRLTNVARLLAVGLVALVAVAAPALAGKPSASVSDPALRKELLDRMAKDQAIRKELIEKGIQHPDESVIERMQAIDASNLARMKEIVREHGWPGPELVGRDGSEAAFLLVQHADLDFQKQILPFVESAYKGGELKGEDYALLLDRVLVKQGKPQVYGTQTRPLDEWKDGEPALAPIEDEAHVDERRAEVGLPPLAEYLKLLKETYLPAKPEP